MTSVTSVSTDSDFIFQATLCAADSVAADFRSTAAEHRVARKISLRPAIIITVTGIPNVDAVSFSERSSLLFPLQANHKEICASGICAGKDSVRIEHRSRAIYLLYSPSSSSSSSSEDFTRSIKSTRFDQRRQRSSRPRARMSILVFRVATRNINFLLAEQAISKLVADRFNSRLLPQFRFKTLYNSPRRLPTRLLEHLAVFKKSCKPGTPKCLRRRTYSPRVEAGGQLFGLFSLTLSIFSSST